MAHPCHDHGTDPNREPDPRARLDRGSAASMPGWVKVLGIVAAMAVIVLLVVLHLTGTLGAGVHR